MLMNEQYDIERIAKMQEFEKMKKNLIRNALDKDAMERLSRVKIVKPELAEQLELYLLQLLQSGQLNQKVNDEKLKQILSALSPKRKCKINRRSQYD